MISQTWNLLNDSHFCSSQHRDNSKTSLTFPPFLSECSFQPWRGCACWRAPNYLPWVVSLNTINILHFSSFDASTFIKTEMVCSITVGCSKPQKMALDAATKWWRKRFFWGEAWEDIWVLPSKILWGWEKSKRIIWLLVTWLITPQRVMGLCFWFCNFCKLLWNCNVINQSLSSSFLCRKPKLAKLFLHCNTKQVSDLEF